MPDAEDVWLLARAAGWLGRGLFSFIETLLDGFIEIVCRGLARLVVPVVTFGAVTVERRGGDPTRPAYGWTWRAPDGALVLGRDIAALIGFALLVGAIVALGVALR